MASDFPQIVYKYRNWQECYHKDILFKNELYLSSPKDLNDPFDCRIPHNYFLLNTNEKIELYAQQQAKKMIGYKGITKENFEELFNIIKEKINKNPQEIQKEYEAKLFNNQDLYYGVLSLSGIWNNILLWSHYSDNHKGFCVGFNESKLQNCGKFGRGGNVIYPRNNNFPLISPLDERLIETSFQETHYKSKDWKYEKEYRLTKLFTDLPSSEDRKVVIDDDFFVEILLGLNISETTKSEIIEVASLKKIPVYQMIKRPFKFELDRIRID